MVVSGEVVRGTAEGHIQQMADDGWRMKMKHMMKMPVSFVIHNRQHQASEGRRPAHAVVVVVVVFLGIYIQQQQPKLTHRSSKFQLTHSNINISININIQDGKLF